MYFSWIRFPLLLKELRDIVFQISGDPQKDPFTAKVQEAIEIIDLHFRPYLKI